MHVKPATKVLLSVMFDSPCQVVDICVILVYDNQINRHYSFTVFVGSSTRLHIYHVCAEIQSKSPRHHRSGSVFMRLTGQM